MKNRRNINRWLAGGLAALWAAAFLCPGGVSAQTGLSAAGQGLVRENSYTAYDRRYADVPDGTATLVLSPEEAVTADGAPAAAETVEGRRALGLDEQTGRVTWSFEVPETGRYCLALDYCPTDAKSGEIEAEILLDDAVPFEGLHSMTLTKRYRDGSTEFAQDNRGNDIRPTQETESGWLTVLLRDGEGYAPDPYSLYLEKGRHTLSFLPVKQSFAVGEVRLCPPERVPTYAEYRTMQEGKSSESEGELRLTEAEKPDSKTSSMLYPLSDRSSAATVPNDPTRIRLNTIGGENWKNAQQTITWKLRVEKDGFYTLGFRFKQNYLRGMYVSRRITVDGRVPFEEFKRVTFAYGVSWQVGAAGGEEPYRLYLTAGEHEIAMTPTMGDAARSVEQVNYAVYLLNDLYRRIIMITGVTPDAYRDYALQEAVPGLSDEMGGLAASLRAVYEELCAATGHRGSESASLLRMAEQLEDFVAEPDTIPSRLNRFHNNISALSTWVLTMGDQSLLLDSLWLAGEGAETPAADADFWTALGFSVRSFIGSFFQDYNSIGNVYDGARSITVWVSAGRDQAEVLKALIDREFGEQSDVSVNLSLVQGALLQATMAGKGPDVALQLGHGDPVNMALREALEPLEGYEGFDTLAAAFTEGSLVPYTLREHIYALPETQNFLMMFCRTDVLGELELTAPDTWEELYDAAEVLHGSNMEIGLPYVSLDAYAVMSQGMGTQSIFPTLLAQRGLSLYREDLTATALDDPEAYEVFKIWTDFYTKYGFPLFKDDYNRFRTGQMPVVITGYTFYSQLYTAAPEIRNLWEMLPIPATVGADGSGNRAVTASGTSCVMLASARNKEACWEFLRWWAAVDTQAQYGNEIENVLGAAGRYNPAATAALEQMPWSGRELKLLLRQQENLVEIPELPGGYYTSRSLDNAFRQVFFHGENPREALNYWNREINAEIARKRKEFGWEVSA